MISTNKRRYLRVGTNLIGNLYYNDNTNGTIFVENISAIGAKINTKNIHLNTGEISKITFKYKDILYSLNCQIIREENDSRYGVKFLFSDSDKKTHTEFNLHRSVLDEFFYNAL